MALCSFEDDDELTRLIFETLEGGEPPATLKREVNLLIPSPALSGLQKVLFSFNCEQVSLLIKGVCNAFSWVDDIASAAFGHQTQEDHDNPSLTPPTPTSYSTSTPSSGAAPSPATYTPVSIMPVNPGAPSATHISPATSMTPLTHGNNIQSNAHVGGGLSANASPNSLLAPTTFEHTIQDDRQVARMDKDTNP